MHLAAVGDPQSSGSKLKRQGVGSRTQCLEPRIPFSAATINTLSTCLNTKTEPTLLKPYPEVAGPQHKAHGSDSDLSLSPKIREGIRSLRVLGWSLGLDKQTPRSPIDTLHHIPTRSKKLKPLWAAKTVAPQYQEGDLSASGTRLRMWSATRHPLRLRTSGSTGEFYPKIPKTSRGFRGLGLEVLGAMAWVLGWRVLTLWGLQP